MAVETFRVAMLNALRIGPYDAPYKTNPPAQEWLIAARGGPGGAYLVISDTSTLVKSNTNAAPAELAEQNSIVAVLAEEADHASHFLMLRHPPDNLALPGRFFPADGMAALSRDRELLRLRAFGRHAHSCGTENGRSVLHDIPHPAPNTEGAINWHFAADERPWTAATRAGKTNEFQ